MPKEGEQFNFKQLSAIQVLSFVICADMEAILKPYLDMLDGVLTSCTQSVPIFMFLRNFID